MLLLLAMLVLLALLLQVLLQQPVLAQQLLLLLRVERVALVRKVHTASATPNLRGSRLGRLAGLAFTLPG